MIDLFEIDVAPTHFGDQSRDGLAVRAGAYDRLTRFFVRMAPTKLGTFHGYSISINARKTARQVAQVRTGP